MAIISLLPGVEVKVLIGNTPAIEYDNNGDGNQARDLLSLDHFDLPADYSGPPPHIVKYIEGKPGAEYSFQIRLSPPFEQRSHRVAAELTIDGSRIHKVPAIGSRTKSGQQQALI